MKRWLQFGAGPYPLPAPWEGFDREVDITKPLPFADGCAEYIHAEHLIEHIPFVEGLAFLKECARLLAPYGVLRLIFPDVERFAHSRTLPEYLKFLKDSNKRSETRTDISRFILTDSNHKSAWTVGIGVEALLVSGFSSVKTSEYGESLLEALKDVDRHHLSSPRNVVIAESTVLEATR